MISSIVEDYLKAIFYLIEDNGSVTTSALADRLQISRPSVTDMLQKLADQKPRLVNYRHHHGVTLTPAGKKIALEVIRHHRLIELYLAKELNYGWDEVDKEAEKLEHVISEEFEERIAKRLGTPMVDPHGDPIPRKDGSLPKSSHLKLSDLEVGEKARITRVRSNDADFLRYLTSLGATLQAVVMIKNRLSFDGSVDITIKGRSYAVSQKIASKIFVERI